MTTFVPVILTLAALSLLVQSTYGYLIFLSPGQEECFYERLPKGQKINFKFEVLDGGSLDIDLTIKDPNHSIIHTEHAQSSGSYIIEANQEGQHTYCFGNIATSQQVKVLMYNIDFKDTVTHAVEHDRTQDMVTELNSLVTGVKHDMDFFLARDKLHMAINDRTNSTLNLWSVVEIFITLTFAIGQTFYIKRFFETRRRV